MDPKYLIGVGSRLWISIGICPTTVTIPFSLCLPTPPTFRVQVPIGHLDSLCRRYSLFPPLSPYRVWWWTVGGGTTTRGRVGVSSLSLFGRDLLTGALSTRREGKRDPLPERRREPQDEERSPWSKRHSWSRTYRTTSILEV